MVYLRKTKVHPGTQCPLSFTLREPTSCQLSISIGGTELPPPLPASSFSSSSPPSSCLALPQLFPSSSYITLAEGFLSQTAFQPHTPLASVLVSTFPFLSSSSLPTSLCASVSKWWAYQN